MAGECCILAVSKVLGGDDNNEVSDLAFSLLGKVADPGHFQLDAKIAFPADTGPFASNSQVVQDRIRPITTNLARLRLQRQWLRTDQLLDGR